MPLSNALFSGVTGLDTTSTAISVIGDNIANVNTPGFKERRAEFADVLAQTITNVTGFSQLGAGSLTLKVSNLFSQGTFETSSRPLDLAVQGRGFFVVEDSSGRFYTRAGIFNLNSDGLLVNPLGQFVQGFGIDATTGLPNGQLQDIQLSSSLSPPNPSGLVEFALNLNADALADNPGIPGPFDPADPTGSSHFQTTVTLYDSLGNSHASTIYFTQTTANPAEWEWNATLPPADTTTAPAAPTDPVVVMGSGTLEFDTDGLLTVPAAAVTVSYTFTGGVTSPQDVDMDFGDIAGSTAPVLTTQFAQSSSTNNLIQDGFSAGTLQGLSVTPDGFISGQFSNGTTRPLFQVALATFPNIEGLSSVGNNNLIETRDSGQALIGAPDSGTLGSIRSSSIEQSNVDLAQQFIRLIINQRAFQANTRTISVTNELLSNLVNLGQ